LLLQPGVDTVSADLEKAPILAGMRELIDDCRGIQTRADVDVGDMQRHVLAIS
jgi:hypothetical protein